MAKTGLIGIVVLAIATIIIFYPRPRYYREFELDESSFDSDAIKMIADSSGLNIPAGSRGLNFRYKPPIDPSFVARIEIPIGKMEEISRQIIPDVKSSVPSSSGGLDEKVSWWNPTDGQVIIDSEHFSNGTSVRTVLTRQNGKLILYVDYST